MFKLIAIVVIAIIALIIIFAVSSGEHMTRIYRGVGAESDANEQPVGSGIVSAYPAMDSTYMYYDGNAQQSCDGCPSVYMCPNCPQFQLNDIDNPHAADYPKKGELMCASPGKPARPRTNASCGNESLAWMDATAKFDCVCPRTSDQKIRDYIDAITLFGADAIYGQQTRVEDPSKDDCVIAGTNTYMYKEPDPYNQVLWNCR